MRTIPFPAGIYVPDFAEHGEVERIDRDLSLAEWMPALVGRFSAEGLSGTRHDPAVSTAIVTKRFLSPAIESTQLRSRITTVVLTRFHLERVRLSEYSFSRYLHGASLALHADSGVYNTRRLVTCLLYLGERFDGGEISFPEVGVEIRPRPGSLLCFYSELRHEVHTVRNGSRTVLVMFAEAD